MKNKIKFALIGLAVSALASSAQTVSNPKFAIKATADLGIGNAISLGYGLPEISGKSQAANEFGIDFSLKIWELGKNSIDANIGLGYSSLPLTLDVAKMDYHYDAPAEADMDNEPYIRYYELDGMHQKLSSKRIAIPLYLNYNYQVCKWVGVHAMLGYKFGINFSPKISESSGNAFCYGVYPQYDDLMIDASYMNEFGESSLNSADSDKPKLNGVTCGFLVGLGAEFRIWGPVSVDLSLRYEAGMDNVYKGSESDVWKLDAENAPVSYTVAGGQKVKPLSHYLTMSKLSRLSLAASLIYRF